MSDVKVKGYGFIGEWKQQTYEPVFGEYTASFILERMLSRIPDKFDKREGSIIYDALAPAAIELEIMYMELDYILKNVFGDTADREGLIRLAYDRTFYKFNFNCTHYFPPILKFHPLIYF